MISLNIILSIVALAMLIVSSIHDHIHKENYYYKGGTYFVSHNSIKREKYNG